MKTAILQCLQQFSGKNSKNLYHDQFLKKVKITVQQKSLSVQKIVQLCKTFVLASK